ncbi:MAG: PqqD family protein [Pseudomonadota bacterium]
MTDECYIARKNVVDCDIGGERALLHLDHNTYFTVNQTATLLWLSLSEPKTIDELVSVMTETFDVEPDLARSDIQTLLQAMADEEIVETVSRQDVR